ncbi:hypothetical protein TrLO_g14651 [Triparma laevis f. longispina]|uniref:Uncharacterized protein n=1 Tax=Triparma laevis f. longispina TaxID=1714387 RepID=A0A9W7L187_9STRA|nr:hypothetical protein TrLO_g14651 [Triparma laevis f. longispina]
MDMSAATLFAQLWLLDTSAKKVEGKDMKIRKVWNNLNGTCGLQYTNSIGLPGGFLDRLFKNWVIWEELIDEEGQRTFIIAFAPLETYEGTHHEVAGTEKMVEATTTGVYIIKELTENTCEWTRAQQADLKISRFLCLQTCWTWLPRQQMAWANELQEKFRRNGKEVDVERVTALAGKMIEWRGKKLMEDQKAVFKSCEELLGGGGEEGRRGGGVEGAGVD